MALEISMPSLPIAPLFKGKWAFYVCFTKEMWDQHLFESGWPPAGILGMCATFAEGDGGDSGVLISIDPTRHSSFSDLVDTIAHESVHATNRLFDELNEHSPSEEMFATITGRVTSFVLDEYFKAREELCPK